MKSTPLLMTGVNVRAILEGRKTHTRRIMKVQPVLTGKINAYTPFEQDAWLWKGGPCLQRVGYGAPLVHTDLEHMKKAAIKVSPYGNKGDKLWIKETWQPHYSDTMGQFCVKYRADDTCVRRVNWTRDQHAWIKARANAGKWRPSLLMFRWASRITITLTVDVRVERVQEISEADAIAEGIMRHPMKTSAGTTYTYSHLTPQQMFDSECCESGSTAAEGYRILWEFINGPKSWDLNPWVYVLEFKRA